MKENDSCICPACKEKSIARKYRANDDFLAPEYRLRCALCGADLGKIDAPQSAETTSGNATQKLAALLGGESIEKVEIDPGDHFRHGCRNCKNFIAHPFKAICALSGAETDPMADCEKFIFREEKK